MEAGSLTRRLVARRLDGVFADRRARRTLRVLAPAAYVAALTTVVALDGVPMARDRLLMWIVLGLLALSVTNVRSWTRGVVLEWLPFALILWAYDLLRGLADGLLFATHFRPQLEADALLFAGTVPTVWLQEHLWHGSWDLRWYDYGAWVVYMSYFLATYLVAGGLWLFARARFRRYVAAVSLLAMMGFATYALFPAAPPWLASQEGELAWTTRSIGLVSAEVPVASFETLFERGSQYANPVAAVPSLHAAYTLLITLFLWRSARWARPLLAAYPIAMAFALVYTAEHYLVDVLLGWIYAVAAVWAVHRVADRWSRRRARSGDRRAEPIVSRAELEPSRPG
jgi:membrane-associated phospholipid phosphatase